MRAFASILITGVCLTAAMSVKAQANREAGDRLAIQNLINAYSHDADRRLAHDQAWLFAPDGTIEVYNSEPGTRKPESVLRGRDSIEKALAVLRKYDVTMHFNGQSTVSLDGDHATGEVYCLAHHIWVENGRRMLMVMGIRYYDDYVRINGQWFFSRRKLIIDWVDKRPSSP